MTEQFWSDLESDLRDPEYARAYAAESIRIATIDAVVNILNDAAATQGLSKAGLARATGMSAAAVRRLLSAPNVNPTVGTVAELAAALGLRLTLEPMTADERAAVTEPMRSSAA
jgi:DNA-binding phage protein